MLNIVDRATVLDAIETMKRATAEIGRLRERIEELETKLTVSEAQLCAAREHKEG